MNIEVGSYPQVRMRRLRSDTWLRSLVAEHNLRPEDLILPVFVCAGKNVEHEVKAMPGVKSQSIDLIIKTIIRAKDLGIKAIAIFPVVDLSLKTTKAEEAYNENNLICLAVKQIKSEITDIGIICDVALDPYTIHGHDGVLNTDLTDVDNDKTIEILQKQALALAKAGADIVAPSDMMDGRIGEIRKYLDEHKFCNVKILSYAVKYASNLYGPFREAVGSKNNLKKASKATYQMDIHNISESFREVALDIKEGADIVMVKPASYYADIITRLKTQINVPIFAYQVSGEYSMLKAADQLGFLDFNSTMYEALIGLKRAGANAILTYAAIEMAAYLQEG